MSNLTNKEVIKILNVWGPEAIEKGLITEQEVYRALGSSSDKGAYKYNKAGGGMMSMDEMIRPIGMAGGGDFNAKLELEIIKLESTIKGLMEDEVLRGVDNSKEIQGNQNWLDYYRSLK